MDTSMGLTPLEGLVMGTRSGDVDPGLHDYLAREAGLSLQGVTAALNRADAGTYGICARCGGQIPPARLEVVPHAASCASCPVAAHAS